MNLGNCFFPDIALLQIFFSHFYLFRKELKTAKEKKIHYYGALILTSHLHFILLHPFSRVLRNISEISVSFSFSWCCQTGHGDNDDNSHVYTAFTVNQALGQLPYMQCQVTKYNYDLTKVQEAQVTFPKSQNWQEWRCYDSMCFHHYLLMGDSLMS